MYWKSKRLQLVVTIDVPQNVCSLHNSNAKILCYIQIVLCYYLGCPKVLRADWGTENTNVEILQPFLRDNGGDDFAGEKSFMYGCST